MQFYSMSPYLFFPVFKYSPHHAKVFMKTLFKRTSTPLSLLKSVKKASADLQNMFKSCVSVFLFNTQRRFY